ncbi:MAG: RMD1 family protein, partial [Saprospiraceae bacterium]|nr:RMD1 family protein [Saprospiraceae bacterium]
QIAMLNTGQSVALEYYELLTDLLLQSTKHYTDQLEQNGDLSTSKKSLLKYIGKTINIKNSIVDNLYILDDPNVVWDSSFLDQFNRSLKTNFDTFTRFKDLDYRLKSVEENLKLFTELLQHRESSRLEWIIIILILLEFLNVLFRGH